MTRDVICYTDIKSPYAWLALEGTFALAEDFDVELIWRPYTLDIPSYLGAVDSRDAHQWRRVRYSYKDARRQANRRGLTLRGPKQIYDSRRANIARTSADRAGRLRPYLEDVFERFFNHTIDVESSPDIDAALDRAGIDPGGFEAFLTGQGGADHDRLCAEAEDLGVFGVPSFMIGGELFWGGDRLDEVRAHLVQKDRVST